jgi:hypothetical protein
MHLDLIDEWHVSSYPNVSSQGRRLFEDVPKGYRLDLVSSVPASNGVLELRYRRHR